MKPKNMPACSLQEREEALSRWARMAYTEIRTSSPTISTAEWSLFVAHTVGAQAYRSGFSEQELSRWLQKAYGAVWVIGSNLNPGMDAKDVRKAILSAYHIAKKNNLSSK